MAGGSQLWKLRAMAQDREQQGAPWADRNAVFAPTGCDPATGNRNSGASANGVAMVNFYPVFLDEHFRHEYEALRHRLKPETDAIRARYRGRPGESAFEVDKLVGERAESLDVPTIDRLLDHIDHAVQVMGIDHVGLGSDFDGISVLPRPMKDVTSLPDFVRALEARGYSSGDVAKILGENFLRVLTADQ